MRSISCFIAAPIGDEARVSTRAVMEKIVVPALEVDSEIRICHPSVSASPEEIRRAIRESAIYIGDFTYDDVHVYYQLGYADALGKHVNLLRKQSGNEWNMPGDITGTPYEVYPVDDNPQVMTEITGKVRKLIQGQLNTGCQLEGIADRSAGKYRIDKTDQEEEKVCFLITPIGRENTKRRAKADAVLDLLIHETMEAWPEITVLRGDHSSSRGSIPDRTRESIVNSAICIVDLSEQNCNVYYELGYAAALEKPLVLIADESITELPPIVADQKCMRYSVKDRDMQIESVRRIRNAVRAVLSAQEQVSDSDRRYEYFRALMDSADLYAVEDELKEARGKINKKRYLMEYLCPAAKAGSRYAYQQMNKYAYKAMIMDFMPWHEKELYFETLAECVLRFEAVNLERSSLFGNNSDEINRRCKLLFLALDPRIYFFKKEKQKGCLGEEHASAAYSFAYSSAIIGYRMYLNKPWKDDLLVDAIQRLETALEFSDHPQAHYLFAVWSLRLSENSVRYNSDKMLEYAREHADKLLDLAEFDGAVYEALELAIRVYRRSGATEEELKQLETRFAAMEYCEDGFTYDYLPPMPDRNDALESRKMMWPTKLLQLMSVVSLLFILFFIWNGTGEKTQEGVSFEWGDSGFHAFAVDNMYITERTLWYVEPDSNSAQTGEAEEAGSCVSGYYNGGEWFVRNYSSGVGYASKEHAVPMFVPSDSAAAAYVGDWFDMVPVWMIEDEGTRFYTSVDEDGKVGESSRVMQQGHSSSCSTEFIEDIVETREGKTYLGMYDGYVAVDDVVILYARRTDLEAAGYTDYQDDALYRYYLDQIG